MGDGTRWLQKGRQVTVENWRRAVTGLSTTGAAQTPAISLMLALIACISASRSLAHSFATLHPRLAISCSGRKILTRRKWPVPATPPKKPPFSSPKFPGNTCPLLATRTASQPHTTQTDVPDMQNRLLNYQSSCHSVCIIGAAGWLGGLPDFVSQNPRQAPVQAFLATYIRPR